LLMGKIAVPSIINISSRAGTPFDAISDARRVDSRSFSAGRRTVRA
jgi:hypothetical protein